MAFDFSDSVGNLIPQGTIAVIQMRLKDGDEGLGVLKRSKNGDCSMLSVEYQVVQGPYAKQKFYGVLLVEGTTDGQKQAAEASKKTLKLILDSALFLDPADKSPKARAKGTKDHRDFDGLRFLAEIGIEPAKNGYDERNAIAHVITKDHPAWGGRPPIEQVANGGLPSSGGSAPASEPAPITKPAWAQ
jgi:hypothetical protein